MKNARLLLIAVVLVVVAILIKQGTGPAVTTDPLIGKGLITGEIVDKTRGITLFTSDGKVEVKQENGRWRLLNKAGLSADKDRIEELFQKLTSAKIGEMVSKNQRRHSDMGVGKLPEGARPGSDGAIITLHDSEGKELKTLMLGKARQARGPDGPQAFGEDGQYVRFSDSDNVYLIAQRLWLEKDSLGWLGKTLAKLQGTSISSIKWDYGEGSESFELLRANATAPVTLKDLEEGMQTAAVAANAAVNFFENLGFDDIVATESPQLHPALASSVAIVLQTFDGLKLTMKLASDPIDLGTLGKVNLMTVEASYSGSDPAIKELSDEIAANATKVLYALREHRVKPVMIKAEQLREKAPPPPPPADTANASDTAAAAAAVKEEVTASHILIAWKGSDRSKAERTKEEAKTLADSLLERINKGEELGKLAEEFSDCPSGKSSSGSLGAFGKGMMAKPFEETAFALKPGEVSKVIETAFGYHIIRRDK